jgi:hypothetical protein
MKITSYYLSLLIWILSALNMSAASRFVDFSHGNMQLNEKHQINIYVDPNDCKGVMIAAKNMAGDLKRVCGEITNISGDITSTILVGTIGHSSAIDELVKERKIDGKVLKGKWEKYIITTVDGKNGRQMVIAGSDRRGTIYGLYELSRQAGVSPWYYWADTPIAHHDDIYIKKGVYTDGEPAVRYRGIFLNDEAPCLTSWVKNTFHTDYGGHEFYAKVFELILRLKGNMMWPAMWGWAFYADDPQNSKTADEMGIMMGTSHHEPMARNHEEWTRGKAQYGEWNYRRNKDVLDKFFREGIERMKGTEDIVTIGMRGDGDEAMDTKTDTKLLENIIANQRRIISDVTGKPAKETPQVWALYKEVLDYYDKGMKVPDDVTMLLCDDNWGNLRRVPNATERKHPGGWGLYYHVDYVGAPRNTKWLNVTPTQNMWEQLTLAYDYGINRMWILNVGDLKPMEYPISLFMDMAWEPKKYNVENITRHTLDFCEEQFGSEQALEAARILNLCGKYNGRVTAEMLDCNTYNVKSGEWKDAVDDYLKLEAEALRQFISLKEEYRDTYRELILFPVQAMANIYQLYEAVAMNRMLYKNHDPEANLWADVAEKAFKRDSLLCAQYNKDIAGGKWDGMMIQKHIGYKNWDDDFTKDTMPEVYRIPVDKSGGYTFDNSLNECEKHSIAIEAEHYYSKTEPAEGRWTVIPYMGRTLSGITVMPYTIPTGNASLTYRFRMDKECGNMDTLKIHVIVKSTLDYLNKGGLVYDVSMDGAASTEVNFNSRLNEKPENIYNIYYPTVARRIVESVISLPLKRTADRFHTITIHPHDPAIVFEKIVIDAGDYSPSYLFMKETGKTNNE